MPVGWDEVLADMTHFMRWTPDVVDRMTITEAMRWVEHVRRIQKQTGRTS